MGFGHPALRSLERARCTETVAPGPRAPTPAPSIGLQSRRRCVALPMWRVSRAILHAAAGGARAGGGRARGRAGDCAACIRPSAPSLWPPRSSSRGHLCWEAGVVAWRQAPLAKPPPLLGPSQKLKLTRQQDKPGPHWVPRCDIRAFARTCIDKNMLEKAHCIGTTRGVSPQLKKRPDRHNPAKMDT